ncbi:MAG: MaoC family dehydratase [Proteobacteria bacterium]|nr:MaoC family dehydratase [Pseudomonadota bacterium]
MRVFKSPSELLTSIGADLGVTNWLEIDQTRINAFADATGDHQWIHVDIEKAKQGPFGAPIAHGYLTASLANYFLPQLLEVRETSMGVNYGCDKIRFPSPVPVGSKIRATGSVTSAEETKDGGIQTKVTVKIEIEGQQRPACVIETISRFYPA